MVLPRTSPCDNHECLNGAQCVVVGTDPRCQCLQGYEGESCETLVSVNFVNRESYLQLPSSLLAPETNISLQVRVRTIITDTQYFNVIASRGGVDLNVLYTLWCLHLHQRCAINQIRIEIASCNSLIKHHDNVL